MLKINKKIIAMLLFLSVSFTLMPFTHPIKTEAALSLSINGMFETVSGGAPAGWEATSGTVSADSTDPYEGAYAMKLAGTADFGAARALSLSANTSYIISFAYKTAGNVTANVGISYTGADTQSFSVDASTTWKTCQQEIITPAAFTASSLTFSASGSGELYIDRLEMWQSEQVYGGDMETLDGWTFYLSNPGAAMGENDIIEAVVDENGRTGSCIKIVNTVNGANPYLWKNVGNIYGEAVYEISADIRCENIARAPGIKIEGYGDATDKLEMSFADVGEEWETVSFQYKPVAGVNRIHLMPRLYGPGTVWFDNIHVRRVKSSESIISEPESLFFYSDESVGTEYLRLVDAYAPAAGGKVHMSITDNTQIVWENTVDVSTSVEIEFPISILEVPDPAEYVRDADGNITEIIPSYAKQYTLSVEYLTAGGSEIASKAHTIQCYDRPTYLTKEGDYIKNGEKVLPVVGYHAPFDDIDRLSEIGVTVVQSSASKSTASIQQTLDEAQKYGVKVLVPLYEHMVPAAHEKNIELTKQAIRLFHDHPALFGWMVQDEPQPATRETNEMYELLQDSYNLIRSHDPDHPIYICECDSTSFVMSGQCCDILSVDPYPNELRLIERVYTTTVAAVNAVHGKKPVYNILQAWEWTGGWEPSADEIRNMAYMAMLGGAKGLGYYPVHDSDGDMFAQPLYEGVNSFAQKEQNILLGNTFNTSQTNDAFLGTMQSGSETYLLVASRADSEITVSYDIGVKGGLSVINGGIATINGSVVSVTVPAHGAVLCRVSTTNLASNGSFEEGLISDFPSNWYRTGGGENPGTTLFMDNTDPYDGNWCVKFDCAANNTINTGTAKERLCLQQNVPLTAGKTYRISYAAKVSSESAGVPIFLRQNATGDTAAAPLFLNRGGVLPSANKWYEVVTYYTPTSTGNALFFIGSYSAHWGSGVFYVDNFRVEEVTEARVDFVNPDNNYDELRVIESPVAGSNTMSFAALPNPTDTACLVTAVYVQRNGALRLSDVSISSEVYSGANALETNLAALLKTEAIEVPDDACLVKTFIWSAEGITPIGESKVVSLAQAATTE